MTRLAALALLASALGPAVSAAQSPANASQRAESLWQAGRPWHAAETLLDAAARAPRQDPNFIVQGARAELQAVSYTHLTLPTIYSV